MNEHSNWPMEAEIKFLTDEGEWKHYAEIRDVECGQAWVLKRKDPTRWRVVSRVKES